jgi:hypothetical protein
MKLYSDPQFKFRTKWSYTGSPLKNNKKWKNKPAFDVKLKVHSYSLYHSNVYVAISIIQGVQKHK